MRRRRLKRKLFWAGIVLALLLIYLASSVIRLGVLARDIVSARGARDRPLALTIRASYGRHRLSLPTARRKRRGRR